MATSIGNTPTSPGIPVDKTLTLSDGTTVTVTQKPVTQTGDGVDSSHGHVTIHVEGNEAIVVGSNVSPELLNDLKALLNRSGAVHGEVAGFGDAEFALGQHTGGLTLKTQLSAQESAAL